MEEYLPSAQVAQLPDPAEEPYVPAGQAVHVAEPVVEYLPAAQSVQMLDAEILKAPASQGAHPDAPPME